MHRPELAAYRDGWNDAVSKASAEIERLRAALEEAANALELWGSTGHVPTDLQSLIVEFRSTILDQQRTITEKLDELNLQTKK